jgi:hypothetical protein
VWLGRVEGLGAGFSSDPTAATLHQTETMAGQSLEDWDIERTAHYVLANNYRNVTLQFPDHLLHFSAPVAAALKRCIGSGHTV